MNSRAAEAIISAQNSVVSRSEELQQLEMENIMGIVNEEGKNQIFE